MLRFVSTYLESVKFWIKSVTFKNMNIMFDWTFVKYKYKLVYQGYICKIL